MNYIRHDGANTRLYRIYYNIKSRCYNPNASRYERYGGKGISMCSEWLNSFVTFREWAINNGYSDDLTIDRIDVNGDYCPSNCRWVSWEEQAKNKVRSISVELDGRVVQLHQLSDETGISYNTLYWRYKHNRNLFGG